MIPKRKTLTPAPAKAVAAMAAASDDAEMEVDLSSLEAIDLSAQDILEVVEIASGGRAPESTIKKKVAEPVTSAIELSEGDFVLLTPSPIAVPVPTSIPSAEQSKSNLRAALAEVKPPSDAMRRKAQSSSIVPVASPVKKRPPMGLSWEEEADVAESCLASIAEQTSRVRGSDPFLKIAPPAPVAPVAPISAEEIFDDDIIRETLPASSRRLPPINPPPFIVRKEPLPSPRSSSSASASSSTSATTARSTPSSPFARVSDSLTSVSDLSTLPVGVRTPFARTLTDTDHAERISATSLPPTPAFPTTASSVRPATKSGSSFPPLSMDSHRELPLGAPAIVNPRGRGATTRVSTRTYRPRTAWILGSAIVGLIGAVVATKMLDPTEPPTPIAPAAQVVPTTPVIAPTESAHTVMFKESEGVSIPAASPAPAAPAPKPVVIAQPQPPQPSQPAPKPAVAAAPKPAAPTAAPMRPTAQPKVSAPTPLVDGSLGMANNKPSTTTASSPKPVATPEPASAARKKPLTPEQELAEAQLRAAMK